LIRHGVTDWNAARRFQGHTDLPLSEPGRAQAGALADRLSTVAIDAVYSSDLRRAAETAQAVAAPHGLAVRLDARLREFAFGAWEGLTWEQIVAGRPDLAQTGWTDPRCYAPEGGETFELVCERLRQFLDEVAVSGAACVAAVTHAGVLHAAVELLAAPSGTGRIFAPGSLTEFELPASPC
jgi:broad specificity phosphatase PhoE